MNYPLTEGAKEGARLLIKQWDEGNQEQYMVITAREGKFDLATLSQHRVLEKFGYPLAGVLLELAKYGLIDVKVVYDSEGHTKAIEILMLQELRNAVEKDFEVSDYFLTMNAVGNIIVNSTTGPVQGVGYNAGVIHQNVEQLADYMTASLGQEFLETQLQLKDAINGLRTAAEADQQSKLGKVISELGNCLQHGTNAAALVVALYAAAPFLQRLLGG
ncbi:MAG: hypothetical protein R3E39_01325 [Anaerolineae bacterium]